MSSNVVLSDMADQSKAPLLVNDEHKTYVSESDTSDRELDDSQVAPKPAKCNIFIYYLSFLSAIGGFLFGYDTGVVSGAMIELRDAFYLNSVWQEAVVSVTVAFAAIFSVLAGFLNDRIGRRKTILLSSVVFTIGALVMGLAINKEMLLCGRMIVGGGIGLASMTVPMYIAESAPVKLRGRLVTTNNLFITGGQLCASIVDGLFSTNTNGWRYMLGLAAIPSFVQLVGFSFMPESPRYLVDRNKLDDAKAVLQKIRGTQDIESELSHIVQSCQEDRLVRESRGNSSSSTLAQILRTTHVRKALFVGCGLQVFQQITGINTVMYYSASIIEMSGVGDKSMAIWLATLTALANFVFTFVGLYLVERTGRKSLIFGSLLGTFVSLTLLAVSFQVAAAIAPTVTSVEQPPVNSTMFHCWKYKNCDPCIRDTHCGYCFLPNTNSNSSCVPAYRDYSGNVHTDLAAYGHCSANHTAFDNREKFAFDFCPGNLSWMPLAAMLLYMAFFAPGMGPMPWTINSEIYPQWARSTCISVATAANWLFNLAVAMSFLTLTEQLTRYGAFWLYASFAFVGLIFIGKLLPETKGQTLEQVEDLFKKRWHCC